MALYQQHKQRCFSLLLAVLLTTGCREAAPDSAANSTDARKHIDSVIAGDNTQLTNDALPQKTPKERDSIIKELLAKGAALELKSDYINSLKAYELAKDLCFEATAGKLPVVYYSIGKLYHRLGDYNMAVEHYYKAMECDSCMTTKMKGSVLSNLSVAWYQLRDAEQSRRYLKQAEDIAHQTSDTGLMSFVLVKKANFMMEEGKFMEAVPFYNELLAIGKAQKDVLLQIQSKGNLSYAYINTGETNKARKLLDETEVLLKDTSLHPFDQIDAFMHHGHLLTLVENNQAALHYLNLALLKATQQHAKTYQMKTRAFLAELYKNLGDHKQSLKHYEQYISLKDSLLTEEKIRTTKQLEFKYEVAQKDKELVEQQLTIERQKNSISRKTAWVSITSLGMLLFTSLSLLLFFLYRNTKHKQGLQRKQIENLEQEQEISNLKAMMEGGESERLRIGRELHDGIGGLLSAAKINFSTAQEQIKYAAPIDAFDSGLQLLDEATLELRKTAHNLMPELLLKTGLFEATCSFCERIQRGKQMLIHVQKFGELPEMSNEFQLSVFRIIQELIHNVVKHAQATHALVQMNSDQNQFLLIVEDDGVGMNRGAEQITDGMGLKNIEARVTTLAGIMEIESSPGRGTTVCIEFKLNKHVNQAV